MIATLAALACPSTSLCFATGYVNEEPAVWYSADPAGGVTTWHGRSANLNPGNPFTCVSARLCVGPWSSGSETGVISSTNPADQDAWTVTEIKPPVPGYLMSAVGCASASLCVAGDGRGNLYVGQAHA